MAAILVFSDKILKIMNCFVCCENVGFENKKMNRLDILRKERTIPILYLSIRPFNHPPLHHFTIGQSKINTTK